jgi:hypothetical protein
MSTLFLKKCKKYNDLVISIVLRFIFSNFLNLFLFFLSFFFENKKIKRITPDITDSEGLFFYFAVFRSGKKPPK